MTLQMLIPTLFGRQRARTSAAPATVTTSPQYRLVVLTLASKASAIDVKVRTALQSQQLKLETAARTQRSGGYLLELDYVLRCERGQRAALVHLVSSLGDTPGVRAIRWETAPNVSVR